VVSKVELTRQNEVEQALHDEFYAGLAYTDAQLLQASAPARLKLYRENPERESAPKQYQFYLLGDLAGKVVCDYACGDGADSVLLAANGAHVIHAFDISHSAVEVTGRRARVCGIESKVKVALDNAEQLSYEADYFDAIYGSSVLHHLNIEKAAKEVNRVLKRGGRAVFREPLEQSKFLASVIRFVFIVSPLKPDAVTPQRQLNDADIELLRTLFSEVHVKPLGIFNRVDRILKNQTLKGAIDRIDVFLLKHFSSLSRYARHVVIECVK
jgi:2-polyprenyl-3-methyl-5-hydroxy-6-metoxy-1,4-benzoquinol methylase